MATIFFESECGHCKGTQVSRGAPPSDAICEHCGRVGTLGGTVRVPEIAVALSGGGHRASLFGLGVLLALVDLGLNRQVTYISSVSGGSITNAFVGTQCAFDRQTRETFDPVAQRLAGVIVNRGILTRSIIRLAIATVVLVAVFIGAVTARFLEMAWLWGIIAAVAAALTFLMLRGVLVERLLAKRLFSSDDGAARFKDFKSTGVEHVVCCTELASGRPVYFTSAHQGRILIQVPDEQDYDGHRYAIRSCPELPVAAAVRASAAFPPFIAPRRLTTSALGDATSDSKGDPRWPLFLSDGGLWSNLATQSLLEDGIFEGRGSARFIPEVVLVANASASFSAARGWTYYIPALAMISLLLRASSIQNYNTVGPRVAQLRDNLRYRVKHDIAPDPSEPLAVGIELSKSAFASSRDFTAAQANSDVFLERSADYREWVSLLMNKLSDWYANARQNEPQALDTLVRGEFLRRPAVRTLDSDALTDLTGSYTALEDQLKAKDLQTLPTVLDRIPSRIAMQVLLRGYANTHVIAYCLNLTERTKTDLSEARLAQLTRPPRT